MMFICNNLKELPEISKKISNFAENSPKTWIFKGEMGAGKTTFIKALGACLGITDTIQSPTYSLVNEYDSPTAGKIYHFDLYRLNDETEALDFGIEEYLDSEHFCWIEWAERIPHLLPNQYAMITITVEDETRKIDFQLVNLSMV